MIDLGTLGGQSSIAHSINNLGQVVGEAENASRIPRAFLYSGERMIDLNGVIPADSGWNLTSATDISDRGVIIGIGTYNGKTQAFQLTPFAR